ncbi:formimidoylglutamase [Tsukamurella soli]|uniref:Formimidoylglutamase n=1 Tax=Tsukamurella soli TaxID=644556 RepID=A0ABP8JT57_9ACTN
MTFLWTGRDDGPGDAHLRWHTGVRVYSREPGKGVVLIGFASDAGVRRNCGRAGAAAGPYALREALAPLALHDGVVVEDAGTVTVEGDALESGQAALGRVVTSALDNGRLPVVLGGGHEVAYGTYSGLAASARRAGRRVGILNLDAHFDLREARRPTSGTPFRQILVQERARGADVRYDVLGISRPNNTRALFDAAESFGVRYLLDEDCTRAAVAGFVDDMVADVDLVYLTIDLDVLPAAVAPGVSAPAGYGVPLDVIAAAVRRVARSGKLAVADVAELNPGYDVDGRTARTAARLIDTLVAGAGG